MHEQAPIPHAPVPDRGTRGLAIAVAVWCVVVIAAWLALNLTDARERADSDLWPPTNPYLFNLLYAGVGGAIVVWLGVRVARMYGPGTYVGRASAWLTAGFVCWAVGNTIWFGYNVAGREVPYPSVADVGFLLLAPCCVIALRHVWRLLALRARDVAALWWIPALMVLVTAYCTVPAVEIAGIEFGRGWLFGSDYGRSQQIASVLYLVSDVVLVSLALMLVVRARETAGGAFFRPLLLTALSLGAIYAGDLVYDQRASAGNYYNGDVADLVYAIGFASMMAALFSFAAAHRGLLRRARTTPARADAVPAEHAGAGRG